MNVNPIQNLPVNPIGSELTKPKASSALEQVGESFQQTLNSLDASQMNSDNLMQQLSAGEDVDIHNVLLATEQTDVSFRIAMAIRDRLVDAYREMMRMSV